MLTSRKDFLFFIEVIFLCICLSDVPRMMGIKYSYFYTSGIFMLLSSILFYFSYKQKMGLFCSLKEIYFYFCIVIIGIFSAFLHSNLLRDLKIVSFLLYFISISQFFYVFYERKYKMLLNIAIAILWITLTVIYYTLGPLSNKNWYIFLYISLMFYLQEQLPTKIKNIFVFFIFPYQLFIALKFYNAAAFFITAGLFPILICYKSILRMTILCVISIIFYCNFVLWNSNLNGYFREKLIKPVSRYMLSYIYCTSASDVLKLTDKDRTDAVISFCKRTNIDPGPYLKCFSLGIQSKSSVHNMYMEFYQKFSIATLLIWCCLLVFIIRSNSVYKYVWLAFAFFNTLPYYLFVVFCMVGVNQNKTVNYI